MKKQVTILGINGGFGQLFSRLLCSEEGISITGVDLNNSIHQPNSCAMYVSADVSINNEALELIISASDIIVICLPEDVSYRFFELYKNCILKTALLVDILSIKREVASIYVENDFNGLSLNPMFGPDLSIEGKNIIIIKFKESQASDWFISLLKTWALQIVYTTSEEHDKMSSLIQVATHAAIIAFGITVNNSDTSMTELLKVSTPPFLNMSALFGRIISGNKKVYWNIQKENVYASAIRKTLVKNLLSLDKSIDEGKEEDFNKLIEVETVEEREIFKKLSNYFSSQFKDKSPDLQTFE